MCREKKEKKYEVVPFAIKKKAIAELETGFITSSELMNKYDIKSHTTISNWKRQVQRGYKKTFRNVPVSEKVRFVNEVLSGFKSGEDIKWELDLDSVRTVDNWIAKYRDIAFENNKPKEQVIEQDLEPEVLKQELYEARLKILALEALISTAEKELKVSIRKKYGTKQSKK